ncbi:MAG TPA: TrmH family RNA methyltransferase [Acidimicrobiales bacterium]|nr:TrmH family RNA methyltransferase [Acidimicrobiales bacterium]
MKAGPRKKPAELRRQRRRRPAGCLDHLIAAPLWVAYEANLGTLLRTCDAVGACLAVPPTPHYRDALRRGDTLSRRPCVHWADKKLAWIRHQKEAGARVLGVELADDATQLLQLRPARQLTVVLLGHERSGIPDEAWDLLDEVVEIPMIGTGSSLNVAVAGSLVLYKLAGLS